jgi:hypothetical protein
MMRMKVFENVHVVKKLKKVGYMCTKSMRSWLRSQNRKTQQAKKNKGALLNEKSWKDTWVSKKQAKASLVALTNKEKENHHGTCKWRNMFGFSIKGFKKKALDLIKCLIWAYKEFQERKANFQLKVWSEKRNL